MEIQFEPESLRRVQDLLARMAESVQGIDRHVMPLAESLLQSIGEEAQQKAPIREGHLRRSMEWQLAAGGMGGRVTFGGMAEAYAEVQHEREDFEHPQGGQSHYLYGRDTSAWNDAAQDAFLRDVADALQRLFSEMTSL